MAIADGKGTDFGTELRRLRLAAGLSQEELAERAGLSAETISALERGARRAPYRHTIELLGRALALSALQRSNLAAAAVRRRGRAATERDAEGRATRLPRYATGFFGRERECVDVARLLGDARLITICGSGGVGKTRLAIETAAGVAHSFAEGAFFVAFASLGDAAYIVPTVAAVTRAPQRAAHSLGLLVAALSSRHLLLIIDNCEHLLERSATTIEAILQGCPRVSIVATSREPLAVDGEALYILGPLDVESAAIELFVNRCTVWGSEDDARRDREVVRSIAQRLEGIPLAIELAAAMARLQPLHCIEAELRSGEFLASAAKRTANDRHRTMEATLAWSYDLLEDAEREALRLLGYPIAGCTWEGARALLAALPHRTDALIRRLIEASLVSESPTSLRLRLHEMTRQFVALKRTQAESDVAARRYAEWLATAMATAADSELASSYAPLVALAPELDNLRAAFTWALSARDCSIALGLASVPDFWAANARTPEGYLWLKRVCDELRPDDTDARSTILHIGIAMCASQSGFPGAAVAPAEIASAIATRHGQTILRGRALIITGSLLLARGDAAGAVPHFEQASRLFTASGRTGFLRSRCFTGFACVELDRRENAETALRDISQLLEHFSATFDDSDKAYVAALESETLRISGATTRSIEAARAAIDLLGDVRTTLHLRAYYSLVDGLIAAGELDEAAEATANEVQRLHERGFVADVALLLERLASIAMRKDRPAFAARVIGWSESTLARTGRVRLRFDKENHTVLLEMIHAMLLPAKFQQLLESGQETTPEEIIVLAAAF